MKATVINLLLSNTPPEVKLTHAGEELLFGVSCFGRDSFQKEFGIFDYVNQFWETMSEQEQTDLFAIYKDIRNTFNTVWDRAELTIELNKRIIKLLDFQDVDRIYQWVVFHSDVRVPEIFEVEYLHSIDKQGSREQTYIKSDYTKLIAMALLFRTMIPVWGEYIGATRQETGTLFKEYYAFQLINRAKVLHSEPMEKLRVYIDHTIGNERNNPTSIIDGISSENFPIWIMGLVIIRRLCVGDVRGLDPKANIVTFIYKYITQKMRGSDVAAENIVKFKANDDYSGDPDNRTSSLERYKIKHDISLGEIVELGYSLAQLDTIAFRLSGLMTADIFNTSMGTCQILSDKRLLDPQMMLLRWIFKPVISPRGLMYLDKNMIVNCFGVLEAVLWARGFKLLSLLSTSYANISNDEMFISSSESRARIPKEMLAELDVLYPFHKVATGKKTGTKTTNLTVKAIDALADNLSMFSWIMTADNSRVAEVFGNTNSRRIIIPSDIKIQLASLAIELGKRNWR